MSDYESRIQLERPLELNNGLFLLPAFNKQDPHVVVHVSVARVELQSMLVLLQRFIRFAVPGQGNSQVHVGKRIGGVEENQLTIEGNCVGKAVLLHGCAGPFQ